MSCVAVQCTSCPSLLSIMFVNMWVTHYDPLIPTPHPIRALSVRSLPSNVSKLLIELFWALKEKCVHKCERRTTLDVISAQMSRAFRVLSCLSSASSLLLCSANSTVSSGESGNPSLTVFSNHLHWQSKQTYHSCSIGIFLK